MELTLVNVLLLVAMVAIAILFGAKIGKKIGYIKGLGKGREEERTYFLSKIPNDVAQKILNEEWERFCKFIYSDDEGND